MTSSPWESSRVTTSMRGPVQLVAGQLLAHVLAGQLAHGHVRLAHLLDQRRCDWRPQPIEPSM